MTESHLINGNFILRTFVVGLWC